MFVATGLRQNVKLALIVPCFCHFGTYASAHNATMRVSPRLMTDLDKPWLSVLIPVYNVEAYLQACVHSVLAQAVAGVEVLLLDDAATDTSPALIRTIAAQNSGVVRVIAHPHNRGLAAARNSLVAQARGKYIWFLDSDDLLLPGAIAALESVIKMHAPDLVLCDFAYVRERPRLKHRLRGEGHQRTFDFVMDFPSQDRTKLLAGLLNRGELHAWSKIARRHVWQQAPFPEGRFFEDMPTIPALIAATHSFIHIAEPWVGYRQRAGSILSQYNAVKLEHLLMSVTELNQSARQLSSQNLLACEANIEDFCLRSLGAARHIATLKSDERIALVANYQAALALLFPNGVARVLQGWWRRGWWLRAIRIRMRLKKAGIL